MRRGLALVLFALALAGCAEDAPAEARDPVTVVALGDSLTRATNLGAGSPGERPASSWATGDAPDDGVASLVERLRAEDPAWAQRVFNEARSGARSTDLLRQAEAAAARDADLVVVLLGANDACAGTSPERFRERLDEAADALDAGLPEGARVYLVSVPDVTRPWELFRDDPNVRAFWETFDVCPYVMGRHATNETRAEAAALVEAYNEALAEVAKARGYHWDGGAVARAHVEREDVSDLDRFHPSREGQAKLAQVAWEAGPFAIDEPATNA